MNRLFSAKSTRPRSIYCSTVVLQFQRVDHDLLTGRRGPEVTSCIPFGQHGMPPTTLSRLNLLLPIRRVYPIPIMQMENRRGWDRDTWSFWLAPVERGRSKHADAHQVIWVGHLDAYLRGTHIRIEHRIDLADRAFDQSIRERIQVDIRRLPDMDSCPDRFSNTSQITQTWDKSAMVNALGGPCLRRTRGRRSGDILRDDHAGCRANTP